MTFMSRGSVILLMIFQLNEDGEELVAQLDKVSIRSSFC